MTEIKKLMVLVVEDESAIAMLVEDMLKELGCEIAASVGSVAQALDILPNINPNFALLDVNLAGERVFPVATALAERNVPFAFATGYGTDGLIEAFRTHPVIAKPFKFEQLAEIVAWASAHQP